MTNEDKLERLLAGFENAVLAASDSDLDSEAGNAAVAGIVAGVLKAYGYQADGSRMPTVRRRGLRLVRGPVARRGARSSVAQEPLRASFSSPTDSHEEDEGGDL